MEGEINWYVAQITLKLKEEIRVSPFFHTSQPVACRGYCNVLPDGALKPGATELCDWVMKDSQKLRDADAQEVEERHLALKTGEALVSQKIENIENQKQEEEIVWYNSDPRDFLPGGTVTCSPWQADEELSEYLPNSGRRLCILGGGVARDVSLKQGQAIPRMREDEIKARLYRKICQEICESVGQQLALMPDFRDMLMLTAAEEAGVWLSESWQHARLMSEDISLISMTKENKSVFHVLPRTCWWENDPNGDARMRKGLPYSFTGFRSGETIYAGEDEEEWQHYLCRAADVFILLGGSVDCEPLVASIMANGGLVLPVACTGGAARRYYNSSVCVRSMPNLNP